MMIVDQLVVQHQTLRNNVATSPEMVTMNEIMALMDQVQAASAHIGNPQQREQLQAILYHWNGYAHERTGTYPARQLTAYTPLPVASEGERVARVTTTRPEVTLPKVHWLVWVVAIVLFVGGALVIAWPSLARDDAILGAKAGDVAATAAPEAVFTAVAATQTTVAGEATATRLSVVQTAEAAALLFVPSRTAGTAAADALAPPTGPVTYTVQSGDTLFGLARRYGLTPNDIMVINSLTTDALTVGQTLVLPHPPLTPESAAAGEPTAVPTSVLRPGEQLVEVVVRTQIASLLSGPGTEFSAILPLGRGTFAYVIGRSRDDSWYLVQLEDGVTRGWVTTADVGLVYPASPDIIPVITTP